MNIDLILVNILAINIQVLLQFDLLRFMLKLKPDFSPDCFKL